MIAESFRSTAASRPIFAPQKMGMISAGSMLEMLLIEPCPEKTGHKLHPGIKDGFAPARTLMASSICFRPGSKARPNALERFDQPKRYSTHALVVPSLCSHL